MGEVWRFLNRFAFVLLALTLFLTASRRGDAPAIWIVYAGGSWDILRTTINGSEIVTLANHPDNETDPAPSPDGEWIAFHTNQVLPSVIMRMRSDGSGKRVVTEGFGTPYDPAWSPDNEWIVFAASNELYRVRPDGSDYGRLTRTDFEFDGPAWSPDSQWIAFNARVESSNHDIYIMRPDGSGLHPLIEGPFDEQDPSWSPDGRYLLFSSNRAGSYDIYRANADGSNITRLTDDPDSESVPQWSPDGRWIAMIGESRLSGTIYIMRPDGSEIRKVTRSFNAERSPMWMPPFEVTWRPSLLLLASLCTWTLFTITKVLLARVMNRLESAQFHTKRNIVLSLLVICLCHAKEDTKKWLVRFSSKTRIRLRLRSS